MARRIVVTGREGQIARALQEAGSAAGHTMVALGRPDFDLERPDALLDQIAAARPDAIVNAAAFTAVDLAESERERAFAINAVGAGAVAAAAARLGVPIVQISTDYVFDGTKAEPYLESDAVGPVSVYGASKLAGEAAVAAAHADHAILRTAWVFAPSGKNFVRTMLALAATRPVLRVVADQQGAPSYAPDLAGGILEVVQGLIEHPGDPARRGVFHMTGSGATTWAGFAEAIFAEARTRGLAHAEITPITTADYPTPARRPAQSRLDTGKLARSFGVTLPAWPDALSRCLDRIHADSASNPSEPRS